MVRFPSLSAFALAAVAAVCLSSCDAPPPADATFVSSAAVKTFDPVEAGDMYSGGAQHQVYEGLLEYHYLKRPAELIPSMAASMPEVSEDGLTFTFRLRDDLVFQDSIVFDPDHRAVAKGRKVVAEDFVYCWKRLMGMPDSQGSWLLEGKVEGLDEWAQRAKTELGKLLDARNTYYPFEHPDMRELISEPVSGLRALDEHTLMVKLTEPYPQFLWTLAMGYTAVYPREALEYWGMEFRYHPVGSGPYSTDEFWPFEGKIRFWRNPTYRDCRYPSEGMPGDAEEGLLDAAGKRLPILDRVDFLIVENSQPRWLRFIRGDLERVETEKDLWEEVMTKAGNLRPDIAAKGVRVEKQPLADIVYLAFNMDDPVVGTGTALDKNPERGRAKALAIRKAISLAYDADRWITVMRNGFWAVRARGPIPPVVAGYVDELSPYSDRDLPAARKVLADAGFPGGKGIPRLVYEATGSDATDRQGADILKDSLKDLGIEMTLNQQPFPKFQEKVKNKQAQMFGMAWGADYPDAQNFLQLFYGPFESPGPNNANYQNPAYDALYDEMKVMLPGPERDEVIRKMLKILYEDCPWSYTDHRIKYSYYHSWLKNFRYNDLEPWAFKYYDIDRAAKQRYLDTGRSE